MNTIKIELTLNGVRHQGITKSNTAMLLRTGLIEEDLSDEILISSTRKSKEIIIFRQDVCLYRSNIAGNIHKIDLPKEIIKIWGEFIDEIKILIIFDSQIIECFFPKESILEEDASNNNSLEIKNEVDLISIAYDKNINLFKIKVSGWVFSGDDDTNPIKVSLHTNRKQIASAMNFLNRQDVAEAYHLTSKKCGFIVSGMSPSIESLHLKYEKNKSYFVRNLEVDKKYTKIRQQQIVNNDAIKIIDQNQKYSIKKIKLSIIVLTKLAHSLCIPLLIKLKNDCPNDELIVVCHNLSAGDTSIIKSIADKIISIEGNFNWSKFNNLASEQSTNDYLLFLNDDIFPVEKNWRKVLTSHLDLNSIIGANFISEELAAQHTGIGILGNTSITLDKSGGPINAVTGAFIAIHKKAFIKVGKFNEKLAVTFNDVEFCMKAKFNKIQIKCPENLSFYHFESSTRHAIEDDSLITNSYISDIAIKYSEPELINENFSQLLRSEPIQIFQHAPLKIKSIAVIKIDHIGDFFSSLNALTSLKEKYIGANIDLFCSPEVSEYAKNLGIFSTVIAFRGFNKISELGRVHSRFNSSKKYDVAIDMRKHGDARELLLNIDAEYKFAMVMPKSADENRLDKEQIKCFYCHNEGAAFTVQNSVWQESAAFVDFVSTHLESVGQIIDTEKISLSKSNIQQIAVFPFSGSSTREWPLDLYIRLVLVLRKRFPKVSIAIFCDEHNKWRLDEFSDNILANSISIIVRPNLTSLISELKNKKNLVISNNSGPTWISSFLKIPFIGIFSGSVDAIHWMPYGGIGIKRNVSCSPCFIAKSSDCHRQLLCLNSISPNQISYLIEH